MENAQAKSLNRILGADNILLDSKKTEKKRIHKKKDSAYEI